MHSTSGALQEHSIVCKVYRQGDVLCSSSGTGGIFDRMQLMRTQSYFGLMPHDNTLSCLRTMLSVVVSCATYFDLKLCSSWIGFWRRSRPVHSYLHTPPANRSRHPSLPPYSPHLLSTSLLHISPSGKPCLFVFDLLELHGQAKINMHSCSGASGVYP